MNEQFFDRASKADYDAWGVLGNPGWSWEDLLPYFIKSTNLTVPPPANPYHYTWNSSFYGRTGPVRANFAPFQWPEEYVFWDAWHEIAAQQQQKSLAQIEFPKEGGSGDAVGVYWVPNSQDDATQTRSDARTAYYDPAAERPNLHLVTGTKVNKILLCGKTAVGVQMTARDAKPDQHVSIAARKEVILAAGPVFSPNLLHLSLIHI